MIIDSHCHAWDYWPYQDSNSHEPSQIPVPCPEIWGNIDQLIYELNNNNIDKATIVSAQIWHNPDNNNYISQSVKKYSDKLYQFADVDSNWSSTYHKEGAAERLHKISESFNIIGFTHYLSEEDDGNWLYSEPGLRFFNVARDKGMIASIAGSPKHQNSIRKVADIFPEVPILCHHMSGLNVNNSKELISNVMESSKYNNIYLKFSGYNYVLGANQRWNFPYDDAMWIYKEAYQNFGSRMVWGSDFPVVKFSSTYKQALETLRTYCHFISKEDKKMILGENMYNLINKLT